MPRQQLAKLTRPRLHEAAARERLFKLLDKKREQPVVWVTGPPGSGKTTLVASYLQATSAPAVWYLLDNGDSDPATFFYYLAQAIGAASRSRGKPLPLLTPEYLPDLEGFSRRFVRDAFTRLPEGSLLVVDNYHEIAADSTLHRMLNSAIAEIPQSANLVVISRLLPPPLFARAQVAGSLAILGWEDLRLDPAETATLIARREPLDPRLVASIHAQSGGWVAGVRLLLECVGGAESVTALTHPEALESAFDYFASEIFDSAPVPVQNVLMRTAFLPRFTTGMATVISGDPQAGQRIEQMYRRRLFLDRRMGETVTYQYHDLFRAFLQDRASHTLASEEIASLATESAALLLAANLADDAFGLFTQAKNWEQAERLFLDRAKTLIAHGRWRTLEEWSKSLPAERLEAEPWLRYWLGRSRALVNAAEAFPILEAAYKSFHQKQDIYGQLLCAATVVETLHFVVEHWETMGTWLDRLRTCLEMQDDPLSPDDELQVHAALFWAAENSFDPVNPIVLSSVAKAAELVPLCADVNLRVSVANMLHYHACRSLNGRVSAIAAREGHRVLDSPDLSADRRALYCLAEGMAHMDFARYREAIEWYDRADAIISANGLAGRDHIAGVWRTLCQCVAGEQEAAAATLTDTERLNALDLPVITQVLQNARAWVAFNRGETAKALACNEAAIQTAETWGPNILLSILFPHRAYMLIASGQGKPAREALGKIRALHGFVEYERVGGAIALLEAWEAHRAGNEERRDSALRESLRLAADERDRLRMRWYPLAIAELVPIAMEQDIEPDVTRTLVREFGLDPPAGVPEAWPWPVKIYTLGRFEILIDEKPLEFGRKAPKRTLSLLKALVALGGTNVPEQRLMDALWPDQEADAAVESLAAALHRLRRLLGSNDTIHQSGGLLSLNGQRSFVDTSAFERLLETTGREQAALGLYRGDFLNGESEPWAASLRERLRGKFIRAVESAGRDLESSEDYERAILLYARGIERDELIEPFYRGLMRCYQKLGRNAEAASAFRRLRQTLSITLGAAPSAETQRLFAVLRLQ
jgi:LuxR family maltose regulon positive regulatory protein